MQAFVFFFNGWHFVGEFYAISAVRDKVSYMLFY